MVVVFLAVMLAALVFASRERCARCGSQLGDCVCGFPRTAGPASEPPRYRVTNPRPRHCVSLRRRKP